MNAWMKVSVAVACVGAMGCEPIDDLASSDGIDAPDVGGLDAEATEDAGRDASQEGGGGGLGGGKERATRSNHDA